MQSSLYFFATKNFLYINIAFYRVYIEWHEYKKERASKKVQGKWQKQLFQIASSKKQKPNLVQPEPAVTQLDASADKSLKVEDI